jgi:hypothetical protein
LPLKRAMLGREAAQLDQNPLNGQNFAVSDAGAIP